MLAAYIGKPGADAGRMLLQHLSTDNLNSLNNDQRIILASHRFAPEVTSAALWLNEKVPSLITCVQLTPYRDEEANLLYLQANTIIPVPGEEKYVIQIGREQTEESASSLLRNCKKPLTATETMKSHTFLEQLLTVPWKACQKKSGPTDKVSGPVARQAKHFATGVTIFGITEIAGITGRGCPTEWSSLLSKTNLLCGKSTWNFWLRKRIYKQSERIANSRRPNIESQSNSGEAY